MSPYFKSIGLLLPSLMLLKGGGLTASYYAKRESFGGDRYYLDLHFNKKPFHGNESSFTGYLSSVQNSDQKISGKLIFQNRQWRYEFPYQGGKFLGVLTREKNRCEPFIQYSILNSKNKIVEQGRLQGGFCS